jgi:hypothetical protein
MLKTKIIQKKISVFGVAYTFQLHTLHTLEEWTVHICVCIIKLIPSGILWRVEGKEQCTSSQLFRVPVVCILFFSLNLEV